MSLGPAIRRFNEKVQRVADDEFRARCLALSNAAIRNTPVDTGRLRANWQAAFGSAPSGTIDAPGGDSPVARGTAAASAAQMRIAGVINGGRGQTEFYLTNNLPYARAVEEGNGRNRPRRMLARAILAASKKF